jgi:hypothetical protein
MLVWVIVILAALCLAQQVFYTWTIHRFVNKLMSRNFFEYRQAEVGMQSQPKIQVGDDTPDEDFGRLSDFRIS